jgi:hypothetical protein
MSLCACRSINIATMTKRIWREDLEEAVSVPYILTEMEGTSVAEQDRECVYRK